MQTSRLNIVFKGIDVEDGARICAPNFEVFYQRGRNQHIENELKKEKRKEKDKESQHQKTSSESLEKDGCKKQTCDKQTHAAADVRGEQREFTFTRIYEIFMIKFKSPCLFSADLPRAACDSSPGTRARQTSPCGPVLSTH